jgi:hypothetical protein
MAHVARTSTTGEGARGLAGLRSGDGPLSVRVRPSSQASGPDGKGQTEPGPSLPGELDRRARSAHPHPGRMIHALTKRDGRAAAQRAGSA